MKKLILFRKSRCLKIEKTRWNSYSGHFENFELWGVSNGLTCQLKWVEDGSIIKLGDCDKFPFIIEYDEMGQILIKTKEKYIIYKE